MNQEDLAFALQNIEDYYYESGSYLDTDYEYYLTTQYEMLEGTFLLSLVN